MFLLFIAWMGLIGIKVEPWQRRIVEALIRKDVITPDGKITESGKKAWTLLYLVPSSGTRPENRCARRRTKSEKLLLDCLLECKYEKQMLNELPLGPAARLSQGDPGQGEAQGGDQARRRLRHLQREARKAGSHSVRSRPAVQLRCWDP